MADFEIKVEGLAELERKLKELGPKISKNALRAATNAGAEVVRKAAIARAPIKSGTLKKQIYKKQIRELSNEHQQTFFVGVLSRRKKTKGKNPGVIKSAFYWRFIEFGTVKMPARPFLRPAFDSTKQSAISAIKSKLKSYLDKVAK